MPVVVSEAGRLEALPAGGWEFQGWAAGRLFAGVTDRQTAPSALLSARPAPRAVVEAEQVHGSSLAVVGRSQPTVQPLAGCDALLTDLVGVALRVRTADCLPLFFAAPARGVVGLAHAGWRGLAANLPVRMLAGLWHYYQVPAAAVHVAIGPAIRSCCYEVGPEFATRFGPFVQERGGRRTCDLIGVAREQLVRSGVPTRHLRDSQQCTACEASRWFSLRREGPTTGRLTAVIMLHS
jgi:YfiH family protein